jgi:hypothetical protein
MRNPGNRPIDDLVFDCCRELFSHYSLDVCPRGRDEFPAPERLALCGVMGFGGRQMRGALVLAASSEALEKTNPGGGFSSQRDWICELANQLMGRLKNRLLSVGVEVLLATPAGLSGENLNPTPAKLRAPQVFAVESGFICVWIECELAEGFELHMTPSGGFEAALPEGETILF